MTKLKQKQGNLPFLILVFHFLFLTVFTSVTSDSIEGRKKQEMSIRYS